MTGRGIGGGGPAASGEDTHRTAEHDADGPVLGTSTTESIGIQDTEQLLALAARDDARCDAMAWEPDGVLMEDAMAGDPLWTLDDESPALQRYQIHVWLADDAAVPSGRRCEWSSRGRDALS